MAINNHFMGKDIVKDLSKFFHSQYFFIFLLLLATRCLLLSQFRMDLAKSEIGRTY